MPLPNEAPENANPNAKPSDRLGYLGMALFVGALLMTPMDKAEAATIKVTNTNDNGTGSLRDAIDISESTPGVHDTIVFDKAVTGTIDLYSGQLYIDDPVTIIGPGRDVLSINAYGNSRIAYIHTDSDDPVIVSGLTFEGGYTGGIGGALLVRHTNFQISDCTISDSYAGDRGGGIFFYESSGDIDNCSILDNTASDNGGGVYINTHYYFGVDPYHLSVTNSTISGNRANNRDGGGIYVDGGYLTLTGCAFNNNSAGDDGGAVGADDLYQLDVIDCTFLYNRSYGTNPRGGGGALNILHLQGPATITGSTISQNSANHKGGGIAFEHIRTSEPIIISDTEIVDNDSFYNGGGIWSTEGNLTISDSNISGNYAERFGGGIFFDSDYALYSLTTTNTTLNDNSTDDQDGGAVYAEDGLLTFTNCTFEYNRADDDGGAIGADDITLLEISGSTFLYNQSFGGNSRGGGGAIWMKQFRGAGAIQDSTILGSYAERKGGALSIEFEGGHLAITDSTISSNFTFGNGGGIYQNYYSPAGSLGLTITNSTLSNNNAFGDGGAIDLRIATAPVQITGCLVSTNSAGGDGGGIFFYRLNSDCPLTISNSVVHGNDAQGLGGGIGGQSIGSDSEITLTNCTISDNRTYLYSNPSYCDGGGLGIRAGDLNSAITIDRCRFLGNYALDDGGGIFLYSENDALLRVGNTTVAENFADGDGGGIYFYCEDTELAGKTLQINNSTISNNYTDGDGGGILFASRYSGFRINSSTISGNFADSDGGGLYAYVEDPDETCFINNCTIYDNYADGDGGGVYAYGYFYDLTVRIAGSIISGNSAGSDGDNLYSDGYADFYVRFTLIGSSSYFINDGGNYFSDTPYLYALANNGGPTKTHKLTVSSPAIDAGINAAASSFDQRGPGFPRNVGGQVDMGAFELDPNATPPNEEQFFGFGPDSDGDGFSDDTEDAAGTDPDDPTENPLNKLLSSESQFEALAVLKAQVSLNFAKPLSDTVKVTGRIPLADGTVLTGVAVLLDIAGNSIAFTLDDKGGGVAPTGKIKVKPPKGGVASFGLSMKGDFQTAFADNADMQNETTPKAGVGKAVRVALALEGIGVYHADVVLSYKATVDKSGKAK
ncbi:MAG: hypothetical protein L6R28_18770 [Planctomycetes bacterium]|nr:hypothetical protein [Planctomycetota bacterium]